MPNIWATFVKKLCHEDVSKIAQSGRTGWNRCAGKREREREIESESERERGGESKNPI